MGHQPAHLDCGHRRCCARKRDLSPLHAINVDAKVPHAVAMHAIQVGPALARLLGFTGLPERRRLGLVWAAAAGFGALVAVSVAQTAAGRAPFDLGPATAALTLGGVALLGTAYGTALLALRNPAQASG